MKYRRTSYQIAHIECGFFININKYMHGAIALYIIAHAIITKSFKNN